MTHGVTATGISFPDGSVQTTASGYIGARRQIFTTSGTFTVPATVTAIKVTAIGGGGGGGGAYAKDSQETGATGGGSGGADEMFITGLVSGATISVTIGAGGTAGPIPTSTFAGVSGGTGGTTSFGSYMTVTGGGGGSTKRGNTTIPASGPTGTAQHIVQLDSATYGQPGGDSKLAPGPLEGTVGGSAHNSVVRSVGGAAVMAAANSATAGNNGQGYGAGGGGAHANTPGTTAKSAAGGTGAAGIVVVEW